MNKLTFLMPSWKEPKVLKASIPVLLKSFEEDSKLIVVLNEFDLESVEYLSDLNIDFILSNHNFGALAVDLAIPLLNCEYVVNVNADMYLCPALDRDLISLAEKFYPCTTSAFLVESFHSNNPIVQVDDLGDWYDAGDKFIGNFNIGKYGLNQKVSYTHPILTKTEDFLKVGGYSDTFDLNWFPGGGLDDYYPWRLKQLDSNYRFITSGRSCVYHASSLTCKRLPNEVRNRNNGGTELFSRKTGMSIQQFRQSIGIFNNL